MLTLILAISTVAGTATALELPGWATNLVPESGGSSIQDEIKCYSLPYGGMGFLSHVLSYWTIYCISISKRPWQPCKVLDHYQLNLILGWGSLLFTILLSVLAMVKCRSSWPLVLIATWKMLLSFSLGCSAIHRALDVKRSAKSGYEEIIQLDWPGRGNNARHKRVIEPSKYSSRPALWLIFYGFGVVIGTVGIMAVVVEAWPTRSTAMEIITAVFATAVLLTGMLGLAIGLCCFHCLGTSILGVLGVVGAIGILAAFYSDWILAAIEVQGGGNWAGFPSSDASWLYWTYFVAKRLPFFST
jgi:hypothetical protein